MKIKPKRKFANKKDFPDAVEIIENFLHSESMPAHATKFLLMFLAIGAVGFAGAALPGIVKALDKFNLSQRETGFDKKRIGNALGSLKRQKLIEFLNEKNGKMHVKLTNKGKERIREFSIDAVVIKKPKRWDGKWRVLIFDIPSKNKRNEVARYALRKKIKEFGFYQLQKSVWIFPHECEDEVLFVAEAFEVEKYIEIITAEKLLHDRNLKKIFDL